MDFRVHVQNPDKLSQTAADALLVVLWGDLKKQRVDAPVAGLLADALAAGDLQAKAGRALYLHRPAGVKAKRLVFAVAADGGAKAVRAAVAAALGGLKGLGAKQLAVGLSGGALDIVSVAGQGTRLRAVVPAEI